MEKQVTVISKKRAVVKRGEAYLKAQSMHLKHAISIDRATEKQANSQARNEERRARRKAKRA